MHVCVRVCLCSGVDRFEEHIVNKDELPECMFIIRSGLVGRLGQVLSAFGAAAAGGPLTAL